jgi:SAM-dependent methyltransferase
MDENRDETIHWGGGTSFRVLALVFQRGRISAHKSTPADPNVADLNDYVECVRSLGMLFDVVIVDGRKRRCCLLEAAKVLKPDGVALLHDASREHYHCAFEAFKDWRFVGDDLWIGANSVAALEVGLLEKR